MGTLEVKVNQATYVANAGTDTVTDMPSPNPEDAGTTYKLSSSEPKRYHYTFTGWNIEEGGGGDSYDPGATYTFPSEVHSVTFYAQWEIDKHKVKYDPNGGEYDGKTTPTEVSNIPYNTEINIADAADREHYDFKGWKETGENIYAPGTPYTVKKDTEFKAQWEIHKQKITYDPNGGVFRGSKDPTVIEYNDGEKISIAEAPTREGYTFLFWKGSAYQPGDDYTVTENHVFVAQWKKNETPEPDPDKPKHKKKAKKPAKPKAVKTGDPVNLELGVILLITSALLCIALFRRRKQRG